MKILILLTAILSMSAFAGNGLKKDDRVKIDNYSEVSPWLGGVDRWYTIPWSGPQTYKCSGTILSPTLVLTAGHCVVRFEGETIHKKQLFMFNFNQHSGGTFASLVDFEFDGIIGDTFPERSDWALLKLETPILLQAYPSLTSLNEIIENKSKKEIKKIKLDVSGMPGEMKGGYIHQGCKMMKKDAFQEIFRARCDVTAGMSGGPIFLSGTDELVGLLSGGSESFLGLTENDARIFKIDNIMNQLKDKTSKDFEEYGILK